MLFFSPVAFGDNNDFHYKKIQLFDFVIEKKRYKLLNFILDNEYRVDVFSVIDTMLTNDINLLKPVYNKFSFKPENDKTTISLYVRLTEEINMSIIDFFLEQGEDINMVRYYNDESTSILDTVTNQDIIKELRARGAKTYKELQEGKTE